MSIFLSNTAYCSQITLAWNQSTDPSVTGYKLYYGVQSRNYSSVIDTGLNRRCTITGLSDSQVYYIATTAYTASSESGFSAELVCCFITAATPSNGQITPGGTVAVAGGSSETFSVNPDAGYQVSNVLIDGVSIGTVSQFTFSNVSTCHSINANFTALTTSHTITASSTGGGSISPVGGVSVPPGTDQTFTITPATNYQISNVQVDNTSVGQVSSYTFAGVTSDHTIAATFEPIPAFTISATVQGGGSISPSGTVSIPSGKNKTFAITPAPHFQVEEVVVDGQSIGSPSVYTFANVTSEHTIEAVFSCISAPVADAGPDQIVRTGSAVTLDGSNSTDASAPLSSYRWTQVLGPHVVLSNPSIPICTFTAPEVTHGKLLAFRLFVTNKSGVRRKDFCLVNVCATDQPPLAVAGPDQTVQHAATVTLNGSGSSDPDSAITSYGWVQIKGPAITIYHNHTNHALFTAPKPGLCGASLIFQLVAANHFGLTTRDQCIINVPGEYPPPVASAAPDLPSAPPASSVTLNGSGSHDPGGSTLTYRWKQVRGVPVTLSNPAATTTAFTVPSPSGAESGVLLFRLTVTNATGLSASDECEVDIGP